MISLHQTTFTQSTYTSPTSVRVSVKTWVHKLMIMLNGRLHLYTISLTFIAQAEKHTVEQQFMSAFNSKTKQQQKIRHLQFINQKCQAFSKLA